MCHEQRRAYQTSEMYALCLAHRRSWEYSSGRESLILLLNYPIVHRMKSTPHCGTQSSCEQFSSNLHLDAHKSQPCGSALSSLDPCALHSALFCVFRALSGCRPPNIRKSVAISQAQFHRLQLVTLSLSSSGILLTLIN